LDLSISGRTLLMKVSNAVVTALLWFLGALMVFGCEKRNDTVVWTEKADRINDVDFHGIEETKQVAQGSLIGGLPLTYYGASYELSGAPTTSQFESLQFGGDYSVWG
jgi:hypothetical protein